ncbi:MAG TPA: hypothetical protein VFU02_24195 [Polyangiaceae bacterium]|nr:hypothetical protein [Polyangiaceae bacterium]
MRYIGAWVSIGCAIVAAAGCAGELEVGEGSQGQAASEGGSTSANSDGTTSPTTTAGTVGSDGSNSTGGESTSGSGGGSWADEIQQVPAVSGSSEGCPTGPRAPDSECETDGLACRYQYGDGSALSQQQCYCVRTSGNSHVWRCFHGSADERCPAAPPEHGSDCYGYFGLGCVYPPEFECSCDSSEGTWDCPSSEIEQPPEPPETIDPTLLVAELTDEERQAWCEWYSGLHAGGPGHPPVADLPVEGGYARAACSISRVYCEAAIPALSVAQCVANLSLSACESPLSNLTGCAIDMIGLTCGPFDYSCLDYLETPDCAGSIILRADAVGAGCNVRVE